MSYMDMEQPRSTDALRAFCEAGRTEHNAAGDYLAQIAPGLQSALRRSVPNGALASALVARRVARHLRIAADLNKTSAQAFMRCWYQYEQLVLNAQSTNAPFHI
jgi:hypothetical protein